MYTSFPMVEVRERSSAQQTNEFVDTSLERRLRAIHAFKRRFRDVMNSTGFGHDSKTIETIAWLEKTKPTSDKNDLDNLESREEFIQKSGLSIVENGPALYDKFTALMRQGEPYMSKESQKRWWKRMRDTSEGSSFASKLKWINREMETYINRWKEVAIAREKILDANLGKLAQLKKTDPRLNALRTKGVDLDTLFDKEKFLDLHYDKRKDLLQRFTTAMTSIESGTQDLYKRAMKILNKPLRDKVISQDRVGALLGRILKGGKSRQEIERFLETDIHILINERYEVKSKYDAIIDKVSKRGSNRARGLNIISPDKFVKMTFRQRKLYVQEMSQRLASANDISKENPVFLKIRHALDVKDWDMAAKEVKKAETSDLSDKDRQSLASMNQYLRRMRTDKKSAGSKEKKSPMEEALAAQKTIDGIMKEMPSSLQPMVLRLLRSPHANRSIHQFRWIVYNNKWCRDNNYLDRKKMANGARKEFRDLTKLRAERGMDIGKHDSLDDVTAGQGYFRKDRYARNRATLLHLNTKSRAATNTLAERLEREQDPKVLYWTTFCAHEDGQPMTENWHNDVLMNLTKLRYATGALKKAGLMYHAPGMPLVPYSSGVVLN